MWALRFTEPDSGPQGPFLADDPDVPKLLELPRLLHAAEQVELSEDDLSAVKELLDAGTGSLGGARPKASVRDGNRVLIAKFASPRDQWDVMAWEKTALDLAQRAGIRVPTRSLRRINGKAVLLLGRFNRTESGARIPYMSAMTLLTARDGRSDEFDYIDIAEALAEHGDVTIKQDWPSCGVESPSSWLSTTPTTICARRAPQNTHRSRSDTRRSGSRVRVADPTASAATARELREAFAGIS